MLKKLATFIRLLGKPRELVQVINEKLCATRLVRYLESLKKRISECVDSGHWFYGTVESRITARYVSRLGHYPDLVNPKKFTEKCQWRKIYCPNIRTAGRLVDKYEVNDYFLEKIGADHIVPVLFVGDQVTENILRSLGDNIVVRPTHSSGQVILIRDSARVDYSVLVAKLNKMLKWTYDIASDEPWYGYVKPRIVVTRMLEGLNGTDHVEEADFHMFRQPNGEFEIIVLRISKGERWAAMFDRNMQPLDFSSISAAYPNESNIVVPSYWDTMVEDAQIIAEDFDYVRVDFLLAKDQYYAVEVTFAPGGGVAHYQPSHWNDDLGSYWHLDTGNRALRSLWFLRTWLPLWITQRPVRSFRGLLKHRSEWAMRDIRPSDYEIT